MSRPSLEMADVVRAHRADYVASRGGAITATERRVLDDITSCRTAALGGHVLRCDGCGHQEISYNSCRNRHCPKCQAAARDEWIAEREAELLPVQYFHVVFTVPAEVASLALQNKKVVYGILFRSAADTLLEIAASEKHLGAQLGVVAVLHTWGQTLQHHPHVHCVVPGGGLSPDQSRWVSCRKGFFLPVRVLGRLFRGKFLDRLRRAFERGDLTFHGRIGRIEDGCAFRRWLSVLYEKDWVVYSKPPFGGPEQVLRYLARYTHRTAIANGRLVSLKDGEVSFGWKDYAHRCRRRVMTLQVTEFLRRFLLHVLPKGFVRIRHYGFIANRHRAEKLQLCRALLRVDRPDADVPSLSGDGPELAQYLVCPVCGDGTMVKILDFDPGQAPPTIRSPPSSAA